VAGSCENGKKLMDFIKREDHLVYLPSQVQCRNLKVH